VRHRPIRAVALAAALAAALSATVAFALPALGRGPAAHVSRTSLALRRATAALRLAHSADRRSRSALSLAHRGQRGRGLTGPPGPRGHTGRRGPAGPAGAAGAAGLSASSFASLTGAPTPIGVPGSLSSGQTVLDLGSGSNGGPLRIGASANVLGSATVLLRSAEASATGEARCGLQISDPASGFVAVGQESGATLTPGGEVELALTGTLGRPAGAWDVRVVCRQVGSSALRFVQGDLQVTAAA